MKKRTAPNLTYTATVSITVAPVNDGSLNSNIATVNILVQAVTPPSNNTIDNGLTIVKNVFNPLRGESAEFNLVGAEGTALVSVMVHDRFGNILREFQQDAASGSTIVTWDGRTDNGMVASGTYFLRMTRGPITIKKTVVVLK